VIQTAWHTFGHTDASCTGEPDCPHSNWTIEKTVDLRPGHDVSGHIDLYDGTEDQPIEIKGKSDFGYVKAVGMGRRQAEGPEVGEVVQAGIYAYGAGAESLRMLYTNKGKHDSFAEWVIPMEIVEPLVVDELRVMGRTREQVWDEGMLPPRWQAEIGMIEAPGLHVTVTGKWPKPFFCGGCPWNKTCRDLPTEAVPLSRVGIELAKEGAE
jgi:hypothetical protein